jgi:hypothetical protein
MALHRLNRHVEARSTVHIQRTNSRFHGRRDLTGSNQIDLKGINFSTVNDSYANGVLTVTDGTHGAALNTSTVLIPLPISNLPTMGTGEQSSMTRLFPVFLPLDRGPICPSI